MIKNINKKTHVGSGQFPQTYNLVRCILFLAHYPRHSSIRSKSHLFRSILRMIYQQHLVHFFCIILILGSFTIKNKQETLNYIIHQCKQEYIYIFLYGIYILSTCCIRLSTITFQFLREKHKTTLPSIWYFRQTPTRDI